MHVHTIFCLEYQLQAPLPPPLIAKFKLSAVRGQISQTRMILVTWATTLCLVVMKKSILSIEHRVRWRNIGLLWKCWAQTCSPTYRSGLTLGPVPLFIEYRFMHSQMILKPIFYVQQLSGFIFFSKLSILWCHGKKLYLDQPQGQAFYHW